MDRCQRNPALLAYSISSRVEVFVAGDATIYGDLSGFTTLVVGAEALEPVGEARGGKATRSEVVGTPSRLTYGLMWSFGRPAR